MPPSRRASMRSAHLLLVLLLVAAGPAALGACTPLQPTTPPDAAPLPPPAGPDSTGSQDGSPPGSPPAGSEEAGDPGSDGDGSAPGTGTAPPRGPHRRNLSGRVPILLYHRIGEQEGRWTRTPTGFQDDLLRLYEGGFRPIRLRDYLEGRIDLPPGYAPVIITFDDGSEGQFHWAEDGVPAPDSAVGILMRFAQDHPDFRATAVFFINADPFGEDGERKARWLVEHGFEVENHTWLHADLSRVDAAAAAREVGRMSAWIQEVTGRAPAALALPFGARPRVVDAVLAGEYEGHAYRHQALLQVGSGPARSPFDPDFDPLRIPRIQVADPEQVSAADLPGIWDAWLERLLEDGNLYAN